jgi:Fic family protein
MPEGDSFERYRGSIDRVFLQILLHDAGIADKLKISPRYEHAYRVLKGQQSMLEDIEQRALAQEPLSISLLLAMHHRVFGQAWLEGAGQLRQSEVSISGVRHDPPPAPHMLGLFHQRFAVINDELDEIKEVTPDTFGRILRPSADAHYLVAAVHPFEDGNGRIARAVGDYVFLRFGMYYDVIMTDYRGDYLDSLEKCNLTDSNPLCRFLEFSYLETLERIAPFLKLTQPDGG